MEMEGLEKWMWVWGGVCGDGCGGEWRWIRVWGGGYGVERWVWVWRWLWEVGAGVGGGCCCDSGRCKSSWGILK